MCGIVALSLRADADILGPLVEQMTETLVHRGPDEGSTITFPRDGVALGMRRLSILDVEGGHQPMWDEARLHCVVFNGEIYNFAKLRAELARRGHRFTTDHSDTEVLVHGFDEWGPGLFPRLNGMFALALWDVEARRLVLARDRMGEKPLYVARVPGGYAVASELRALLRVPGLSREVDHVALEQYLGFDYVLPPRTILAAVQKLRPGHYAVLPSGGGYEEHAYWTLHPQVSPPENGSALGRLDELLGNAVRARMVADVPVGLFLSGGLDSSTIGYYMRRHSDEVHSFSIGFSDPAFDESPFALLAAKHLRTKHHHEVFSERRVQEIVPRIAEILDEPMADQSILPTYLLSTFTRQHAKVALGGDGSDELLMGYPAYQGLRVADAVRRLPAPLRRTIEATAQRLPGQIGPLRLKGVGWARGASDDVARRVVTQMPYLDGYAESTRRIVSREVAAALPPSVFDETNAAMLHELPLHRTWAEEATAAYLRGYLAEDILVKVDRASMAASLEVRSPFLDAELVDFLLSLPPSLKLRRMKRKYLLRSLMADRLPQAILRRPKFGFNAPVGDWLRGPLAPLVREHLAPDRIAAGGFFDVREVARSVEEHLRGAADRSRQLWQVLQFELWRAQWLG